MIGGAVSHADLVVGGHTPAMEPSPFAIPAKKLAMWLFIIADIMTFAACLVAYGFLRNATPDWPRPFHSSTVINVMVMTFILVSSSLTMLLGVRAARASDRPAAFRWTFITLAGGVIFVLLHIREWGGMIGEGVTLFKNPWGTSLFGAAYFSVTGLELLHVIAGLIALIIVGLGYRRGRYSFDDIENCGLFWQFINIVWMFVVPLVYLLNVAS
ncbi:MAG TPA: cytochrome c oxidase subunit 3 [Candidatus Acidoferrum sp.]|nr:cytochrome c oxidase subunit 3 [Candidatus Acidoferrum sp.]